jgi:hypothetical protein
MLSLPDVRHFVQEQPLQPDRTLREIIAVEFGSRMKMQVAARRHHGVDRLERKPAPSPDTHRIAIDRIAEDRAHQRGFARRQRTLGTRLDGQWCIPCMSWPSMS